MPHNPARFSVGCFSPMNHPYVASKFRERWLLSDAWGTCCLFIVALCLSEVAPANAQTRVPPPPAPGTRRTPSQGWGPPPERSLGTRETPSIPRKPTPSPKEQSEYSLWFNVGVITAIAALITALAGLVGAFRQR